MYDTYSSIGAIMAFVSRSFPFKIRDLSCVHCKLTFSNHKRFELIQKLLHIKVSVKPSKLWNNDCFNFNLPVLKLEQHLYLVR